MLSARPSPGYTETSKNERPLPSAARSQGKHTAPSAWGLWKGQLRTPESQGVRALGQQQSIRVDFSLRAEGDAAGCSCTFSRHPSPNLSRVSQPWSIRTLYSGDLPLLLNSTGCWKQLAGHDPWAEPCHWRWSKCYTDSQAALLRLNHPSFSSSSWWDGGFKTDCPLQQSDVMVMSLVSARQGSSKPCPFPSLPKILWSWARFPSCKSQLFTCTVGIKLYTSRTCLSRTNIHPIHHDLPLPLFLLTDTASIQCKGQDQAET